MKDIDTLIAIGSFAMGVGSTLATAYKWNRDHQRKAFAAEREFNHLLNDNKQLREFASELDRKVDELTVSIVEMRGAISILIGRGNVVDLKLPTMPKEPA